MNKGIAWKGAVALAALGMTAPIAAATASATPDQNLAFQASGVGASAGWTNGPGSTIDLTVGTSAGTFALVQLKHAAGAHVGTMAEPTFTTDNYAAGSPRYYIVLNNKQTLWGYPSNAGLNGGDFAWAIDNGNTYETWPQVQAAEAVANVSAAYVIADGVQSGVTDQIDNLQFDGITFNG